MKKANKQPTIYDISYRKYYKKHKKLGWKSVTVFGPIDLVNAVKEFTKQYKARNDLYIRNVAGKHSIDDVAEVIREIKLHTD